MELDKNLILDNTKLMWHKERVEAWLRGERIAPITIDCALTRACTYRCVYCYSTLQKNKPRELTRDIIFRFLDDAAAIGVKGISFVSDGESTCSPHFYDAVKRGKSNGLDMAVGTNGVLLKKEKLPELLRDLTYLRFNISAGEAERYAEIMGCRVEDHRTVCSIIEECVRIKRDLGLSVTIGLQMVFMPDFSDQVMPLAELGRRLGVDYLVIKHCSDDENGSLGVDYRRYEECAGLLRKAEGLSGESYLVRAKWSKILGGPKRKYTRCYGPPFILQMSGTGLVAPCGMFFNDRYKRFHIGNICDMSFRDIWESERYWDVMKEIASPRFDANRDCGCLCLQHKVNEFLWDIKNGEQMPVVPAGEKPQHINFV
jgi:MoaA/NifB/PqqE/SkfB family radical SAM enzyme